MSEGLLKGVYTTEENISPSPKSHKLPIEPQMSWGLVSPFPAKVNSRVYLPRHALEASFHICPPSSGSFIDINVSEDLEGMIQMFHLWRSIHRSLILSLVGLSLLYGTNAPQSCPWLVLISHCLPQLPLPQSIPLHQDLELYSQYIGTTIDLLSSRTNGLREGLLCFAPVFEMACHSALFFLWHFIILPLNTPGLLFCASFNGLTPHHLFEICLLPKVPSFFILAPLSNSF